MIKKFCKQVPEVDTNESELKVTLPNGSTIRLFGADNPDSIRWLDLRWVIFDEYSQQPANIYSEIVFPMLNANNGFAVWIWTPKWKNAFYSLFDRWSKDERFYTKLLWVSQTKLLNEKQLQDAKKEMTQEEYEQEYECSFTAAIKWAYYKNELALARKQNRITKWVYDPILPVFTVWDLGMSDYMAILFVQVHWNSIRIFDSISENGKWFDYYAWALRDKWYSYEQHYFPHDIEVRELTTGLSRFETVRDVFWIHKCSVLPKLWINDGINAVRRIFHNIWINDSLEDFINAVSLYKQKYDEKRDLFLNTPEHDWTSHYADALRYTALAYNSMKPKEYMQTVFAPEYL